MLAKKKKLTKKQIQEDKLVTYFVNANEFYKDYQTKIWIVLAAVMIVVAALLFYNYRMQENNRTAETQLSKVLPLYESGSYTDAIQGRPGTDVVGLLSIVDEYGSTETGEMAKILLGNCYYFLGRFDEAEAAYEDYSGSNNLYESAALAGIAGCYVVDKDYETAAEYFRKASQIYEFNNLNAEYIFKAGVNYLDAGNHEMARKMFEKLKDDYNTTRESRDAGRYLAVLDIKR